jgi:tetratricopeptide (TPR) repeat protein
MENLQELIKKLNKSEKKMVRKFLSAYSSKGKSDTVSLKLFDILDKRKRVLNNKDCSHILFNKDDKNRMRVLKSRLKQKVLDALTTDIILDNQTYDTNVKISIQLKKKLQQFQLLMYSNKGNQNIYLKILDDVIKKSKKNELFSIQIEALELKKMRIGFREGMAIFDKYEQLIKMAAKFNESKNHIANCYYKMILMYRTSNPNHEQIKTTLKEYIEKGDKLLFKANSLVGQYYLNIIKCGYYMEIKDYESAIHVMENQLTLLHNSKVVYRKLRVGATYDYLSESYINMGDFNKASESSEKALEYFAPKSTNYIVAQELSFRAKLYGGNLKLAEKLIIEIITAYKDDLDKHRISTHLFFQANIYFAKKDFKKCNRILSQSFEFKQDRTGWEYNVKLLHIMCLIEQDKIEEADTKFINLNRQLKKYNKTDLSSRNKLIATVMKIWLKEGGNKILINLKGSTTLNKLNLEENSWDPMKSELIPFHKWIETKI